jgi:hypothetical protein
VCYDTGWLIATPRANNRDNGEKAAAAAQRKHKHVTGRERGQEEKEELSDCS